MTKQQMLRNHTKMWELLATYKIADFADFKKYSFVFVAMKATAFATLKADYVWAYCYYCEIAKTDCDRCYLKPACSCENSLYEKIRIAIDENNQEKFTKLCLEMARAHESNTSTQGEKCIAKKTVNK